MPEADTALGAETTVRVPARCSVMTVPFGSDSGRRWTLAHWIMRVATDDGEWLSPLKMNRVAVLRFAVCSDRASA